MTDGSKSAEVLREAAEIVEGVRSSTHGDKERSFGLIAEYWEAFLSARPYASITATDVAIMMTLLKIARIQCGEPVKDHFLDAAGYMALAYEVLPTSTE